MATPPTGNPQPELRSAAQHNGCPVPALAKEIGSKLLRDLDPLVSAATLLRWHRDLVAPKWTFLQRRRPGRPRTKIDTAQLIVRMTGENPGWRHSRIHGALRSPSVAVPASVEC